MIAFKEFEIFSEFELTEFSETESHKMSEFNHHIEIEKSININSEDFFSIFTIENNDDLIFKSHVQVLITLTREFSSINVDDIFSNQSINELVFDAASIVKSKKTSNKRKVTVQSDTSSTKMFYSINLNDALKNVRKSMKVVYKMTNSKKQISISRVIDELDNTRTELNLISLKSIDED